jgi:hypothetical protein
MTSQSAPESSIVELLRRSEEESKARSLAAVRRIRQITTREIANVEEPSKPPPNAMVEGATPKLLVVAGPSRIPPIPHFDPSLFMRCLKATFVPPYLAGSPRNTVASRLGTMGFTETFPAEGRMEFLGATVVGDETASTDGGVVHRDVTAFLALGYFVWNVTDVNSKCVRLQVPVTLRGSTLMLAIGEPKGFAYVSARIDLAAMPSIGATAHASAKLFDRFVGPPPNMNYRLGTEPVDASVVLSLDVPTTAAPGQLASVLFSVTAQLLVGVSANSDLWAAGNFSSLSGPLFPGGTLTIPSVSIVCC